MRQKQVKIKRHTSFMIKLPTERELLQAASNYSSNTEFKNFVKLTKEPFLVNDTALPSENPFRVRKKLL